MKIDIEVIEIGVGPHELPWPTGDMYDPNLLRDGDRRNVLDKYRYWTVEAIKSDLDKSRIPLEIAIENFQHDMNIGTIVRNANAFNISAVHIIGKRHWNRRGAMVTDAYMHIYHHETVKSFVDSVKSREKQIVAMDIVEGAQPLAKATVLKNAVLVFGGEGPGLSPELLESADSIVMIEQLGSTRSVNVGVASGIAMYAWLQQHVLPTL